MYMIFPKKSTQKNPRPSKRVVLPYFHKISHNIKALASRFNVGTAFSTDYRLSRLTPFASTVSGCAIKHREKDVECSSGVIYKIPFDCGLCYIGQTKRCINERLTEHKRCIKKKDPYSEVSKHLIECRNCVPLWHLTSVELREKDDHKRLIKESLTILGHGNAVNKPSFGLDNELRRFLKL